MPPESDAGLRVLLIERDTERSRTIDSALAASGHAVIGRAQATLGLHDEANRLQADLVVIDVKSTTRAMLDDVALMSERSPRPVVIFTDEDDRDLIRAAVHAGVTAYIVDGLAAERVGPIVQVALARFEDYRQVREERDQAQARLAERKLIDRAKGILMSKRGIGEEAAYHALRRIAMEKKLRMSEVAEQLIGMSELLG